MTYPIPNYSRVWVRGRIIDLGKAVTEQPKYGVTGTVTFTPSVKVLVNRETQQIIASSPFRVNVTDDNGYFQIQLPASDDPDVTPTNFTYNVQEPGTGRTYNIIAPQDTPILNKPGDPLHGQPVIELSDVVPAPGPSAGLVQLVSGRGIQSIDIIDGNWVATYTDGATSIIGPAPVGEGGGGPVSWDSVTGKPVFAEVATTGAYADLTGKPSIPAEYSDELAQDAAAALFTAGGHSGVTFTYDDAANRLTATVTVSGGDGGLDEQQVNTLIDSALEGLAAVAESGAYADLSGTPTLAVVATSGAYADLSGKPTIPAQYADLSGTVPSSALPALAITDVHPVADEAAMLALTAQRGDVAVRSDNSRTYILSADTPGTLSAWVEIPAVGQVQSVAGKQGVVTLAKSDVGLGNVDNTSDASKPVSESQQDALDAKAELDHGHTVADIVATGTPSASTYLRGDGTWATPPGDGASGGTQVYVDGEPVETYNVDSTPVTIYDLDQDDTVLVAAVDPGVNFVDGTYKYVSGLDVTVDSPGVAAQWEVTVVFDVSAYANNAPSLIGVLEGFTERQVIMRLPTDGMRLTSSQQWLVTGQPEGSVRLRVAGYLTGSGGNYQVSGIHSCMKIRRVK